MVSHAEMLPAAPERLLPLQGLALAALLHGAVALLALAISWRGPDEPPVFEVTFALPAPVPQPVPSPEPVETLQPAPPTPAPDPPAVTAPRPTAKPAPPAPTAQPAEDPFPAATPAAPLPVAPSPPAPAASAPVAPPAPSAVPPLQAYAAQLRNLLAAHRDYPHAARLRRQEGIAMIALTIDRAGQLAGARLYEGSAFPLLDEAALVMARRAAPFPPPPLEPHQRQAVFVVPVGFALQE